jgi:hypothetical protein
VHPDLIALVNGGDVLYMARTDCGGVALALVRDDELVIGVGALTKLMPLSRVGVHCERIGALDVEATEGDLSVEVTISGTTHRFAGAATAQLEDYEVRAINVVNRHFPGIDENLVIVHVGNFPAIAASEAWPLLKACEMVDWAADSSK